MNEVVIKEMTLPVPCKVIICVTDEGISLANEDGAAASLLVDQEQWYPDFNHYLD